MCSLLAENGDNVEAAQLKAEVTALQDSVHSLLQAVLMQISSVGQDLLHWQDYKSGLQEVKPWIEEAEVKVNMGLPKPVLLQEAQNLLGSTRVCIRWCILSNLLPLKLIG
jgi:hypothetical protein